MALTESYQVHKDQVLKGVIASHVVCQDLRPPEERILIQSQRQGLLVRAFSILLAYNRDKQIF